MKSSLFLAALMNLIISAPAVSQELSSGLSADAPQNDAKPLLVSFRSGILYSLDINTGGETQIFVPLYRGPQRLTVAPNNELVAFVEEKPGKFHTPEARRQGRYDVWAEGYIRVVSPEGRLVQTLEDGEIYTWSPDGKEIAYVTYDLMSADHPHGPPTGLWIFDLTTGERKKISRYAQRLEWAEFDNNLYFTQSSAVLRYNTDGGVIDTTVYLGIDFSPDGHYYYVPYDPLAGQKRQIYDTATNEVLFDMHQLQFPQNVAPGAIIKIVDWVKGSNSILLIRATTSKNPPPLRASNVNYRVQISKGVSTEHILLDVAARRVIKEFEGLPSKWVGSEKVIVVERGGKVVLEEIPDQP